MAVFPSLSGLHVQIHNTVDDDNPLPEYDIVEEVDVIATFNAGHGKDNEEDEGPKRKKRCRRPPIGKPAIVKYLQTGDVLNMGFRICWRFEPDANTRKFFGRNDIQANVYLDGEYVTDVVFKKKDLPTDNDRQCKEPINYFMDGKPEQVSNASRWIMKPFQFSELIIDSESHEKDKKEQKLFQQVGVIKVEMYRIISKRAKGKARKPKSKAKYEDPPVDVSKKVKEKSVKGRAISHAVSLKAAQPTKGPKLFDTTYTDGEGQPFATFIFHYRTLGMPENLKNLGIVERTPPPVPLEERPIETLTDEEFKTLAMRQIVAYTKRYERSSPS